MSKDRMSLAEIDAKYPSGGWTRKSRKAQAMDRWKTSQMGKFGASSEVRRIDPTEYPGMIRGGLADRALEALNKTKPARDYDLENEQAMNRWSEKRGW